jgi:hypothetical protein
MSSTKFFVTVSRVIETTVEVEATDARAARALVERRDFELPPRDDWEGRGDWRFAVADADHNDLIDEDGNDVSDKNCVCGEPEENHANSPADAAATGFAGHTFNPATGGLTTDPHNITA